MSNKNINSFLKIYLYLFLANILYNTICNYYGLGFPWNYFLYSPDDRFADFFKYAADFPNFKISHQLMSISYVSNYLLDNEYMKDLMIYHTPPFSFFFFTQISYLSNIVNIFYLYFFFMALLIVGSLYIINKMIKNKKIIIIFLFLYPLVFAFDRGHILSFLSFYFILLYVFLIYVYQDVKKGLLFLTLALCIRPNFFPLLFFIFTIQSICIKSFFKAVFQVALYVFSISTFLFFIINMFTDLEYSIINIIQSLDLYHKIMIIEYGGLRYGTSIYLILTKFLSVSEANIIVLFLFFINIFLLFSKKISQNKSLFLFVIINTIFTISPVNADYYLILYFIPLIFCLLETNNEIDNNMNYVLLFLIALLLAPKGYWFSYNSIKYQLSPYLNVAILVISYFFIFRYYFLKNKITSYL